jgi:hypothetical protein
LANIVQSFVYTFLETKNAEFFKRRKKELAEVPTLSYHGKNKGKTKKKTNEMVWFFLQQV